MSGLRVGFVLPSLAGGGAEKIMVSVADGLSGPDLDCCVLSLAGAGRPRRFVPRTARLHEFNAHRVAFAMWPLIKWIRREKPDAVVTTMHHVMAGVGVARRCRLLPNVRLIARLSTHATQSLSAHGLVRKGVIRNLLRSALKGYDAVIAPTEGIRDDLVRRWGVDPEVVFVIPNPLFVAPTASTKATTAAPSEVPGQQRAGPLLVSVGRLHRVKGYDVALYALRELLKDGPVRWRILGDGTEREGLEALAATLGVSGAVEWLGFVDDPRVEVAEADVFVLPSRREGFPNALAEALPIARRIVATDCLTGPREILASGRWGVLVPPDNPRALADGIRVALRSAPLPRPVEAWARFSPERVLEGYRRVIAGGPQTRSRS
jgi:glycosyltransferase involved in cell wall biosynthesis